MFSEAELLKAINELEKNSTTYQDAEKLATFYILYDHLYRKPKAKPKYEPIREVKIDRYNGSEFLYAISGKRATDVWKIVNETMEIIKVVQPDIYKSVIERLSDT